MTEKIMLQVTREQLNAITAGLLELPGKICLPILQYIDQTVAPQLAPKPAPKAPKPG